MSEGFLTNLRTAELFFRFCKQYKIDTREDRTLLLREITRRKKARYLRDVNEFIPGKKVLVIKRENK